LCFRKLQKSLLTSNASRRAPAAVMEVAVAAMVDPPVDMEDMLLPAMVAPLEATAVPQEATVAATEATLPAATLPLLLPMEDTLPMAAAMVDTLQAAMAVPREAMAVDTLPLLLPTVDMLPAAMAAVMVDTHLEATRLLPLLMVDTLQAAMA
jgi:hypothetical protein